MLKKWHKYWGTEKLLRRVNKGIPDSVRGEVWKHVLDIEGVKEPDIYEVKSVYCLCVHISSWHYQLHGFSVLALCSGVMIFCS